MLGNSPSEESDDNSVFQINQETEFYRTAYYNVRYATAISNKTQRTSGDSGNIKIYAQLSQ